MCVCVFSNLIIFTYIHRCLFVSSEGNNASQVAPVKNSPVNAGSRGDVDLIPEVGRFPGGGQGNPF